MARAIGFLLALSCCGITAAQTPPKPAESSVLARVVTIGASVTEGAGSGLSLRKIFDHAIRERHTPVQQRSTVFWAFDLEGNADRIVDETIAMKATLVIGVDVLFWFAYGRCPPDVDEAKWRIERVDIALEHLARLKCPVVVGDVPDMSTAKKFILSPKLIPSRAARKAVNRHLAGWAAKRPNVIVAPVGDWVTRLRAGRWVIRGSKDGRYPDTALTVERALSGDGLHLSAAGQLVLADSVVTLVRKRLGRRASGMRLDPWEAAQNLGVLPKPRRRSL